MPRIILVSIAALFTTLAMAQESAYTLEKCLEIGLANNIGLEIQSLDVNSSEQNLIQSKANLLPNLNASASHGYNWGQRIDPFTNQFATDRIQSNSFGISTGVMLFNGFSLQNRVKQADINLKIAEVNLETSRNSTALAIANAYLSVLFNEELNAINEANLTASTGQVDRIQKLVDAGQIPEADLFQAQAQMASDEARVISSQNAIDLAELNLMQLIQLPEEDRVNFQVVKPKMTADELELPSKDVVLLHALSAFPEIRSAELNQAGADIGYKIANGSRYPSLSASYSYGSGFSGANQTGAGNPINLGNVPIGTVAGTNETVLSLNEVTSFNDFETVPFFDQLETNVNRSLFFSLNIPIFNGLSNKTNVQLAKINRDVADLRMKDTRNQLTQTVESAYADAKAALKTYQAADFSLKAQEEAFKYAEIRYQEQVINGVDYAQARSSRDAALAEKIRSQYDYIFRVKIVEFYQGKSFSLN